MKTGLSAISDQKLRQYATYASIGVALTLILAKLVAYFVTDSVALLSSLVDSAMDLLASMVAAFGVAHAMRPADREHRFGHGKAEALAALLQAAFILGSSALLCVEALGRLFKPRGIENEAVGYGIMIFAIVMTLGLLAFQRYVIHRTKSMAIGADRLHYSGDILINAAVGLSLWIQQKTGQTWPDPVFALGIAGIMTWGAWQILRRALNVLMDRELPKAGREKIKELARAQPGVLGLHDLRTRSDGEHVFIEIHLEMDPSITVLAAHDIAESVINRVGQDFPNADILVHQDPFGLKEQRRDEQIRANEPAKEH